MLVHHPQKQPLDVFCKKAVLKNVAAFTGKHSCWSFKHRCFPVNIAMFLREPILKNISETVKFGCWRIFGILDKAVKACHMSL